MRRNRAWGLCGLTLACFGACTGSGGTADAGRARGARDASAPSKPAADAGPQFDAGSDPNRNRVQPGQICARLAQIRCASEAFCCKDPGRDRESCRSALETECRDQLALDEIAADPLVEFDAKAAGTALAELERRSAVCDPSVAAWASSPEGFGASFLGSLGRGEDCEPEGGLQAPLAKLAAALASCRVGDGLACLPSDKGWMCTAPAARGGACFSDFNCVMGLYCDNPKATFSGSCAEHKQAGAACDAASACSSFMCKDGACQGGDDVQAAYCLM